VTSHKVFPCNISWQVCGEAPHDWASSVMLLLCYTITTANKRSFYYRNYDGYTVKNFRPCSYLRDLALHLTQLWLNSKFGTWGFQLNYTGAAQVFYFLSLWQILDTISEGLTVGSHHAGGMTWISLYKGMGIRCHPGFQAKFHTELCRRHSTSCSLSKWACDVPRWILDAFRTMVLNVPVPWLRQ